ncbi:hypothetical protein ACFRCQ_12910 [Cytobacillus firmus]|uniref:hypothetical protein n=1 Tax=Cytobacillus firmus TaxID=1399 RepID=UPI00368809AE
MQVISHISNTNKSPADIPLEIKTGEVSRAQIKERLSDTEAVINIRGREFQAKFEGGVPSSDRVTVQITDQKEQAVTVKTIAAENPKSPAGQAGELKVLQSVGLSGNEKPELKKAVQTLLDKGSPISKEIVRDLKEFMDHAKGTTESKLETVKALANKRLEATGTQLRAVHEALHGKPLSEVLTDLAKEIDPKFRIEKRDAPVQKHLDSTIPKNDSVNVTPDQKQKVQTQRILNAESGRKSVNSSELSKLIQSSQELLENEPDLKKAIQQIRTTVINHPSLDRELAQNIEKAAADAEKLQAIGKERLVQALKNTEDQLLRKEQQAVQPKENVITLKAEEKPVEIIRAVKDETAKNPDIRKSIELTQNRLIENPKIVKKVSDKLMRAVQETKSLANQGRITAAKEVMTAALSRAETELRQIEARQPVQPDRNIPEQRPSEAVKQVKAEVQNEPDLQRAVEKVREQVVQHPRMDREVAQKVERALTEAVRLQQLGQETAGRERIQQALTKAEAELKQIEARQPVQAERSITEQRPSEVVKQVKAEVQNEPDLQRAVEKVREQVVQHPKMDREVAQKVERALNEAVHLQQIGQETVGRERIQQALTKAETELKQIEARQPVQRERSISEQRPSETVKQVKAEVQNEPDLQRAVEKVREQVVQHPKMDREVAQKVERALNEASRLLQFGQETAGRERIQQALAKAETELTQIEARQPVQSARSISEQRPSEAVKQVKAEVQNEPNLQRAVEKVREQVVQHPKMDRDVVQKVEKTLNEATRLQQIGQESAGRERIQQALTKAETELKQIEARQPVQSDRNIQEQRPSEAVKQVKAEVQNEPDLQRAVEKVREQVVQHPRMDREVAQKVDRALSEAVRLQQIGQETAGRERIQQALTKAETELKQIEARQPVQSDRNIPEQRPSEAVKQVKAEVQNEPDLQRAVEKVREQVVQQPKMDREVAQKVERALNEASRLQQIGQETAGRERIQQVLTKAETELKQIEARQPMQLGRDVSEQRPSEAVKQVKAVVQNEPDLQRAVEKVREQVVQHPKMDREVAQKVERALSEASRLQQIGQETAGRERIQQALTKAVTELKQIEARQPVQSDRSISEKRPSEAVKQVKAEVQNEPDLQRALEKVREHVVQHPKMDREVAQKVERALTEAVRLKRIGQETAGRERIKQALTKAEAELKQIEARRPVQSERNMSEQRPSEATKQAKVDVQNEPNLQRAVEKVREQVVQHPKMDREVAQKVGKALNEAVRLQQVGQETAGRERLQQALTKAETELKQIEAHQRVPAERIHTEQRSSEAVKQVKAEVQNEPDLQHAIEKVRSQIVNNPSIDKETARNIEKTLNEADLLQRIGRESAGREVLEKSLTKAEAELKRLEAQGPKGEAPLRETFKQVREQIQSEANTKQVLQKVQEQLLNNKQIDPSIAKEIEKLAKQTGQLDQAGRDRILKVLQQAEAALKQTGNLAENNAADSEQLINKIQKNSLAQGTGMNEQKAERLPSEAIKQLIKQFQKEPDLTRALDLVRKEITSNPGMNMSTVDKAEKAISHAAQLQEKGRELGARQHMAKELSDLEQTLAKSEPKMSTEAKPAAETLQFDLNEQLQTLGIQSKDILVTKVTQKLAQATHDFRELKREITRNLDNLEHLISKFKKNAYPQAKQMLETAISKLDNAILKSEMMLFTDMKTEKQLMQASSQLAEAKKLLAKGDHAQAGKIVSEVKTLIDKVIFKPSEQKVVHFVAKESMMLEKQPAAQHVIKQFNETASGYLSGEPSARQMFEMVKSMGLNHDSDIANSLVFNKNDQSQQEQQQQNLKAALMKLAQGEGQESNSKIAQQAEQALTNLTGQQLLSKSDASGTLQSMFFNLPMLLGGKPENLQVFVNSKNEGQQVDWENCNLYFLLETKKLGDVGILLNSTDRNLSITIKNDLPGFKERMEPLAAFTKEKLQEVGYNVSSINFTRMSAHQPKLVTDQGVQAQENDPKPLRPVFTEKGMDFKI